MACVIAEPLRLPCGATLPNRLAKSAMTEGLSDSRGRATPEIANLYRQWSHGGTGLLITGNIQVDRRYPERPGNVAIDGPQEERELDALRKYAEAAKSGGSACWVQLGHAGRQCDPLVNTSAVGPSAVPWNHPTLGLITPTALTLEEVEDVRRRFVDAAKVCEQVGFDGVQLHCAHGYLLSSFLNPLANTRDDQYGGSLENRARLMLDTCRAVREAVKPQFAVAVKINSADFQKGGFTPEECAIVAKWLDNVGVDLIEISGGNYENAAMILGERAGAISKFLGASNQSTIKREAYFLQFVPKIRAEVKSAKLMVTGGIRSRVVMEDALNSGNCDVIGIARPLCGEPDCSRKLLEKTISALPSYEETLKMPLLFRPLNLTSLGPKLTFVFQQMWCYYQERLMGAGLSTDRSKNLVAALVSTLRTESQQASNLEGLTCVGQVLNRKPVNTGKKSLAVIMVLVAVLFLKRAFTP